MKIKAVTRTLLNNLLILFFSSLSLAATAVTIDEHNSTVQTLIEQNLQPINDHEYTITKIVVAGNNHLKTDLVLQALPYKKGDLFDASLSALAINNIYASGHVSQVELSAEIADNKTVILHVTIEEKKLLEEIEIAGNKSLKTKKIKEKLNLDTWMTIDEEMAHQLALGIKVDAEENHHFVDVNARLEPGQINNKKMRVVVDVHEGTASKIKYVHFIGNEKLEDRKLRSVIQTRENWLMSFMDQACLEL